MTPQEKIKKYLDKRASEDALFRKSYEKPNKSIDECWKYILGEISAKCKEKGVNACAADDEEIYGMAVHYYDEDNLEVKNVMRGVSYNVSSSTQELSPEEKKKAKEEAIADYKRECKKDYKDKRIKDAANALDLTEEEKAEAKKRAVAKYEERCIEMAKDAEREREAKRAAKKNAPGGEVGNLFG